MLALALAVAGCAALGASLKTSTALQNAGYQDASVNVEVGSGFPSGGVVSVSYSRGPAGSDESDAKHAAKIVWDTYSGRFGGLSIVRQSGGCTGPVCAGQSGVLASATYAQLAATFGPRPKGLDKGSAAAGLTSVPPWAIFLGLGLALAIIVGAFFLLRSMRRKAERGPGPPPWQPGPPPGPPGGWPAGPPQAGQG